MAKQKDLLGRLADAGEDAIGKLADVPGGSRLLDAANALRDRVDELQKRIRHLDPLEQRVAELEARLAALEKKASRPRTTRSTTAARKPAARKKTT
jgi:cell division septum initiation protein DivIVA